MVIKQLFLIPTAIALMMVAGCSHDMTMQDDFGNSVKTNMAKQTINPDAGKEQLAPATMDGQKAEKNLKAYREGDGKAPNDRLVEGMVE